MGTPFQTPSLGDDVIVISPQNITDSQEFEASYFNKQRNSVETSSNPSNTLSNPPNSLNSMFFKTRLCVKFRSGYCPNGDKCNFAHGSEELRKPPPNWQDIVGGDCSNRNEHQRIHKKNICRKFYDGEVCPYGDRCTFLHVERGTLRASSALGKETAAAMDSEDNRIRALHDSESIVVVGSATGHNQKPTFWKTRICNRWETTGHCSFGDNCHFAHGHAELKMFSSHTEIENANTVAVPTKPVYSSRNVASASTNTIDSTSKHQPLQKKGFAKWEPFKLISHIYADWIDDLPPLAGNAPPRTDS